MTIAYHTYKSVYCTVQRTKQNQCTAHIVKLIFEVMQSAFHEQICKSIEEEAKTLRCI